MHDNTDLLAFPELPDEAVVALNRVLEDFYIAFQNHYYPQIQRWYQQPPPHDSQLTLPLDTPF